MIMAGLAGVQQKIGDFGAQHNLSEGDLAKNAGPWGVW